MRISDWSSDVCSSDLPIPSGAVLAFATHGPLSGALDGLDEPALLLTPAAGDDGLLKPSEIGALDLPAAIGRASCRERVGQDVEHSVDAGSLEKKREIAIPMKEYIHYSTNTSIT